MTKNLLQNLFYLPYQFHIQQDINLQLCDQNPKLKLLYPNRFHKLIHHPVDSHSSYIFRNSGKILQLLDL